MHILSGKSKSIDISTSREGGERERCVFFLNFVIFETRDLFNISYSRELYLVSKFLHFEEIVRVKMAVCFEMIVSET